MLDRKYRARGRLVSGTSNPVNAFRSFGGVARNVAENLTRLGAEVRFVSIVGNDETGRAISAHIASLGADVSGVMTTADAPTAEYAAILDTNNELALGIADMEAFDLFTPDLLDQAWPLLASASWVFADCNLPAETLAALIARRRGESFKLAIDPVSTPKSRRLPQDLAGIDLLFLNHDEAAALVGSKDMGAAACAKALLQRGAQAVLLTEGGQGYLLAEAGGIGQFKAVPAKPVDITGAGDAMIAGTLYGLLSGRPPAEASRTGALLATLTTESTASVRQDLNPALFQRAAARLIDETLL